MADIGRKEEIPVSAFWHHRNNEKKNIRKTAEIRAFDDIGYRRTVPDGATLVLWLVQGEVAKSVDVTNLSGPLEYPLNEFENGRIFVRLQINGVENTVSEIYIR